MGEIPGNLPLAEQFEQKRPYRRDAQQEASQQATKSGDQPVDGRLGKPSEFAAVSIAVVETALEVVVVNETRLHRRAGEHEEC